MYYKFWLKFGQSVAPPELHWMGDVQLELRKSGTRRPYCGNLLVTSIHYSVRILERDRLD
jgi:hypothetical protein